MLSRHSGFGEEEYRSGILPREETTGAVSCLAQTQVRETESGISSLGRDNARTEPVYDTPSSKTVLRAEGNVYRCAWDVGVRHQEAEARFLPTKSRVKNGASVGLQVEDRARNGIPPGFDYERQLGSHSAASYFRLSTAFRAPRSFRHPNHGRGP